MDSIMGNRKIGVFDSGYGGLTIFKEIESLLPEYDYIYLGDNSRAPYGSKSFETVYHHTRECIEWLINQGCTLVIIACNTASARALRTIQQVDLAQYPSYIRVLGVIRPTAEIIGDLTISKHIGILATEGTVNSKTYPIEINNFFPEIIVSQKACKLWVPIIEDNKIDTPLMRAVIENDLTKLLSMDKEIDMILLGCTHFPLVAHILESMVDDSIKVISQGSIVAASLSTYISRHTELSQFLSTNSTRTYFTTDDPIVFESKASMFLGKALSANIALIS